MTYRPRAYHGGYPGAKADPEGGEPKVVRRSITPHETFRRSAGYTVTGLARALGFSHAYVSRVEGGQLQPSARYREALARLLRVPEDLIFGEGGSR
jgi:DNA-binding XRE family transcriptional regulator